MYKFVVISIHKVSFSVPHVHLVTIMLDFLQSTRGGSLVPVSFFQKQISQKTWKHWINACVQTVETFNLFHKIKAGLTQLLAPL